MKSKATGTSGGKQKSYSNMESQGTKKLNSEISETLQLLKELEKQADKISDIANQGSKQQDGFLSTDQVKLVKKMLQEMEQEYNKHYKKLEQMQKTYNDRKRNIQEQLIKAQKDLNQAEGGDPYGTNPYGDRADDKVIQALKSSLEKKQADIGSLKNLESQIEGMKTSVDLLGKQRERAQDTYQNQIGNMHEMTPARQGLISGASMLAGVSGAVLSTESLINYFYQGTGKLREGQYRASDLGQKMQVGYEGDDEKVRKDILSTGKSLGYNGIEGSMTTKELMSGGQLGDVKDILKDLRSSQQFGRAYSTDPNEIAHTQANLKKMGAMQDGDMSRFANLIAGAISKNGMAGREEEQLRSSSALLEQVMSKLGQVSEKQVGNVVGLQTQLGEAVPSLRGEKGAQVLGNIDQGIKDADSSTDILLGWGTKYQGIAGREQLELMKEQGIANPENVKTVLGNVNSMVASPSARNLAIAKAFNLPVNQVKMLQESGMLDKMSKGEGLSDKDIKDLESQGEKDLANQLKKYNNSESKTKRENSVSTDETQTNIDSPISSANNEGKSWFNKQPTWLRGLEIAGLGILGSKYGGKLVNKLGKKGIKVGFDTIVPKGKGIFTKGKSLFGSIFAKEGAESVAKEGAEEVVEDLGKKSMENIAEEATEGVAKEAGTKTSAKIAEETVESSSKKGILESSKDFGKSIWNGTKGLLGKGFNAFKDTGVGKFTTKWAGKGLDAIKGTKIGGAATKFLGKHGGKLLPFGIGAGVDTLLNKATSNDSWGKSATKGILGTALTGLAIAGTSAITGGAAIPIWASLGLGVGGGVAGDKLVDKFWKNGKKDSQSPDSSAYPKLTDEEKKRAIELREKIQGGISNKLKRGFPETYKVGDPSSNEGKSQPLHNYRGNPNLENLPKEPTGDNLPEVKDLVVSNLKIDGNTMDKLKEKSGSFQGSNKDRIEDILKGSQKEHNIKITVDGKIDGMTEENQNRVSHSISSYFGRLFGGLFGGGDSGDSDSGFDLSKDQVLD